MPDQPVDQVAIESEVELMRSPAVAQRVIDQLRLDKDPEFNSALAPPSVASKIKDFITLKPLRMMLMKHATNATPSEVEEKINRQNIVNAVTGRLNVNRVGLTRVIEVSFSSTSKEKAAEIANTWAEQFIEQKLITADAANKQETDFLSKRIDGLRSQVEAAERGVQQYKIAHNLLSAQGATLTEQELSDLNRQLATARLDQAESQARLATVKEQLAAGSHGDDVGETLNSQVIANLRTQAATFSSRLADLQTRYGPLHPEVVKVKQQLSDTERQIDAEIKRIVSNLSAQDRIQRQRAGVLASSVERARGELAANSKAMVELQQLELNAESVRALYESYLDRLKQTATGAGAQTSNARIVVNAAISPKPSSPKLALSLVFAIAAGGLAGGGAVAVRRAFDAGLTVGTDIEQKLGVNYLAGIPALASTLKPGETVDMPPCKFIQEKRLSAFSESFRSLRVSLFHASAHRKPQVVAITSALPGEGKTTTSSCLAVTLASTGAKVILVDCDLRRRGINSVFGVKPEKGLVEVLEGKASLDEAISTDGPAGLHILALSETSSETQDFFQFEPVDRLIEDLRSRYDVVLLDTAPVLPVAETRILAQKVDAVALLVRWRSTPVKAAQRAVDLLKDVGVTFAGAALTQIDIVGQTKYGYGDAEYYFKSYKGYYQA
jgi:capsular exopolysaccharide synthesis family protein